mgnify:FL=1
MMYFNKQAQRGFTLVEIMVALGLGLFLTAGASQIFLTTKNTNRTQENLSRMQENARFAMYFLTNDIREADYSTSVCGNGDILKKAYNNLDVSASDAQYQFNSFTGIVGTDNDGDNNSDSITLAKMSILGTGSIVSNNATNNPLDPNPGFKADDILLVTDCNNADIFQKTNNEAAAQIAHGSMAGHTPGNKSPHISTGYTNARVYFLSKAGGIGSIKYDVAEDGDGIPGLRQNGNQLVANIENMQILYGERKPGGDTYYVPADTAGLDMDEVVSVRVSLLVRSPDKNVTTQAQVYNFNGASAAASDGRLMKVYTSTITVRNRLP